MVNPILKRTTVTVYSQMLAFVLLLGTQNLVQANIQAIHDSALKATVRVEAHGFAASGFMYGNSDRQLVTNLHAVLPREGVPSTSIRVKCGNNYDIARVVRVLREADLVLLETENVSLTDMGCLPLRELEIAAPQPKEKLDLFGFRPGNSRTALHKETVKLSAKSGSENLEGLVDDNMVDTVRGLRMPDPKLPLYHVGTGLYPGFSGGPVLNHSGKLVGVVDGGLDNGLKSHAWVIPAINIQKLIDSPPTSTLPSIPLRPEFGIGFSGKISAGPGNSNVTMQSGGNSYQFEYIKTRTLKEILRTADPTEGLDELFQMFVPEIETDAEARLAFDIYQELDLGLIVAVPSGRTLIYDPENDLLFLEGSSDQAAFAIKHDRNTDYSSGMYMSHDDLYDLSKDSAFSSCTGENGQSFVCDLETVRTFDYGGEGKLVRFGYTEENLLTGEKFYNYDSLVSRGADLFYITAVIDDTQEGSVGLCLQQPSESACGSAYWDVVALTIATQLTTVNGLLAPDEGASVQTFAAQCMGCVGDDNDNDSAAFQDSGNLAAYAQGAPDGGALTSEDLLNPTGFFYMGRDGRDVFVYTGGTDWLVNIGGQMERAVEINRATSPDGSVSATLQYGTSWYLVPLGGGMVSSAAAGQQQWTPFLEVFPQLAAYLEQDGQTRLVYVGGTNWLINLGGQFYNAVEVSRENVPEKDLYVTVLVDIQGLSTFYRLPLAGGVYDFGVAGQWTSGGELFLRQ